MDTVLGVSMAPTAVRMVLVAGENADGLTVDEDGFDVNAAADAPTVNAADQVVSAILGTREGATESGYQVRSTGVTWTDPIEAAALRDAAEARAYLHALHGVDTHHRVRDVGIELVEQRIAQPHGHVRRREPREISGL